MKVHFNRVTAANVSGAGRLGTLIVGHRHHGPLLADGTVGESVGIGRGCWRGGDAGSAPRVGVGRGAAVYGGCPRYRLAKQSGRRRSGANDVKRIGIDGKGQGGLFAQGRAGDGNGVSARGGARSDGEGNDRGARG